VAWIRQTLDLLAVPGLGAFGLTAGQAAAIAAQALTSSSMQGNPVPLSQDELEAIIGRAL
jgi:alcohol dehydrogenase class IV